MRKMIPIKSRYKTTILAALWAVGAALVPAQALPHVVFAFTDGTALDKADVGATMTTGTVTITTLDLVGQDGSKNSEGAGHKTNIFGNWNALGINDENVSGNEYGSFDSGEAWVFSFNVDVRLAEIDLAGQGAGAELTIRSSAFADIVLPYVDSAAIHNLSNTFVSAGTAITFEMTSPTNAADTSLRVATFTVIPASTTETANGTPHAWLDTYYTGLVTSSDYQIADLSDSDGDAMPAWQEYIAGTTPTHAASVLRVTSMQSADRHSIVSWQSVTGKYYSVVVETNLVEGAQGWTTVANNLPGREGEASHTTGVSSARAVFYKVGLEKREIYLLIGQSNMAGRGPIEAEDEGEIEGCELFNFSEAWEPATNPLNQYSTIRKDLDQQQLNPGYGFALRMREVRPGITLGLVVNARGGTNISEWEKGTTYYNEAIRRARAAREGGAGRLAGILWHQGESNSSQTNSYMDRLAALIADFRADLGDPDLPFVIGQLERDDTTVEVKDRPLNDVLVLLPAMVPNTACATTEGLTTLDGTHFDSASQRELGRRYADALISME